MFVTTSTIFTRPLLAWRWRQFVFIVVLISTLWRTVKQQVIIIFSVSKENAITVQLLTGTERNSLTLHIRSYYSWQWQWATCSNSGVPLLTSFFSEILFQITVPLPMPFTVAQDNQIYISEIWTAFDGCCQYEMDLKIKSHFLESTRSNSIVNRVVTILYFLSLLNNIFSFPMASYHQS